MTVIHFLDLEDMIPELHPARIVRVNKEVYAIHTFVDNPDASIYQISLSVRQTNDEGTLSWMIATGQYETLNGKPIGDNDIAAQAGGWTEVEKIEEKVTERLLAQNNDFKIRPGIIDLGSAGPMLGIWSYLIIEEVILEDGESNRDGDENSDGIGQVRSESADDGVAF